MGYENDRNMLSITMIEMDCKPYVGFFSYFLNIVFYHDSRLLHSTNIYFIKNLRNVCNNFKL